MENFTIAIDGPSGAGKSTITGLLSKKLGFHQLNTGALYRAVGVYCLNNNLDPSNEQQLNNVVGDINITVDYDKFGEQHTILNGEDISNSLYTPQVTNACSLSSQIPSIRELVLKIQKEVAKQFNLIIEGRDIGSVVLPNANFKFYIDASPEIRAKRRINDEKNKNDNLVYENVLRDIIERDRRDMERKISPLVRCSDAIYINTDNITAQQAVDAMYNIINKNN